MPTTTDDLVTWLRHQIDEDERLAHGMARATVEIHYYDQDGPDFHDRFTPAWVLAECEAKRDILFDHEPLRDHPEDRPYCGTCRGENGNSYATSPCTTLKILATSFADRPGYREEWRP